jgi:hypothetical protein
MIGNDRPRKPDSLWSFWKAGLDHDHLRALHRHEPKPSLTSAKEEPFDELSNRFATLIVDDAESDGDDKSSPDTSVSHTMTEKSDQVWTFGLDSGTQRFASPSSAGSDTDDDDSDPSEADTPPTPPSSHEDDDHTLEDVQLFLHRFGMPQLPKIPQSDRSVEELLADGDVWLFSMKEREKIAKYVEKHAKQDLDQVLVAEFGSLREEFQECRQEWKDLADIVSRSAFINYLLLTMRTECTFSKAWNWLALQPTVSVPSVTLL